MSKSLRKKEAQRRAKRKKRLTLGLVAVAIVIIVALIINGILTNQRNTDRVYARGGATVTLTDDNTFIALLWHGDRRIGTFSESEENGARVITFIFNETSARGKIEGNVLHIPLEWDDVHGHGREFVLR